MQEPRETPFSDRDTMLFPFSENISDKLQQWSRTDSHWAVAEHCRERIERFQERTAPFQKRMAAPLIVAMLGGTGTGKSTLLNAIVGEKIVKEGRERPTTNQASLVCHQDTEPTDWNIDLSGITVIKQEHSALEQLILLDCPDPDTTENEELRESNLARLRSVLPICDVILVTVTQQKYRSRRVLDELADAAPGARLVFVQTHAERDNDIRDDWQEVLKNDYDTGHIFLVDSLRPCPVNELDALRKLLTQELNSETALRLRQANYVSLAEEALEDCKRDIAEHWEKVHILRERITGERRKFGRQLAVKMRDEIIRDRQIWESQLVGRVAAQWGYSPFSLVLRIYQGLGLITSGLLLARGFASPSRLALWGAFEGFRSMKKWSQNKKNSMMQDEAAVATRFLSAQDENLLRASSITLIGYAAEASLPTASCETDYVLEESKQVAAGFIAELSKELDRICTALVARNNRWWTRAVYETLFGTMLLFLLMRPAKNFFIDTVFFENATPYGGDFYLVSLFWLLAWAALLLGFFIWMLRRGLEREVRDSAVRWETLSALDALFAVLEKETNQIMNYRDELELIRQHLDWIERQSEKLEQTLGKKKIPL